MYKLFLLFFLASTNLFAQYYSASPKREFRGVWIATVANLDWPKKRDTIPAVQMAELDSLLQNLKNIGFNAVIFQIRSECDALYCSLYEPWSYWLTGVQGKAPEPEWDPLQYAIEAAHKYGMEFHAWLNPFRAERVVGTYPLAANHVVHTHPEWILTFNNTLKMLDPGIPEVREYITNIVVDVVKRYNVDGVHWDDYFYPYSPNLITTHDDSSFAAYNPDKMSKADWRRANINMLVKMVSDSIKAIKPWVKFGISPFGVWKNERPNGTSGYDNLYHDAVYWMQQRYLDYLTPQLYWQIGSVNDYSKLLPWWNAHANGRHVYPGQAAYRIHESNWNASELMDQIKINRETLANTGSILFRATLGVLTNPKGFTDSLKNIFFRHPAIVPTMPWIDSIPPLPPLNLTAIAEAKFIRLQWQKPLQTIDGDSAQMFVVYKSQLPDTINTNNPGQILAIISSESTAYIDSVLEEAHSYAYAVTSLDKLKNESTAAVITVPFASVASRSIQLPEFLSLPKIVEDTDTSITIHFTLLESNQTLLVIYDRFNREIATVVDRVLEPGSYFFTLFTHNIPEGVYYSQLISGVFMETKKMFIRK